MTGSATQRLSLVLDPRGRIHSLSSLKAEGAEVVEHDAVDPDVMSKLVKDLESPEVNPRAAELFAKRKSMAKGMIDDITLHFSCLPVHVSP